MRFWLGPWVWDAAAECWTPPAASLGCIDLRNRTQCAQAGGVPQGVALFLAPNDARPGSDYANLGNDLGAVLSGSRKSALRTLLKLPRALASNTLGNALYEALTLQADPTDEDRCPPLMPTVGRDLEVWLGGEKVFTRRFRADLDEAASVREMLRRQYRALRQASRDGRTPPQHYRKVLGYWVRKYKIAARWFQPDDLPDEQDLPPETTLTDDFNRSDADGLGNSSEGWSWTETNHDIDIVSNVARGITDSNLTLARAESDLSSADHYCELTISNPGGSTSSVRAAGPACRYSTSAMDFYVARQTNGTTTGTYRPAKVVSGTRTDLGTGSTRTVSALKRISISGSSIDIYSVGVVVESITDSSIAGGVRCGIFFDRPNNSLAVDGWSAADLAVAAWPHNVFGNVLVGPLVRGVM